MLFMHTFLFYLLNNQQGWDKNIFLIRMLQFFLILDTFRLVYSNFNLKKYIKFVDVRLRSFDIINLFVQNFEHTKHKISIVSEVKKNRRIPKRKMLLCNPFHQWPRTTISQDVQTRFSVQLAFAEFLSKIKGNFWGSAVSWYWHCIKNFPLF